MTTVTTTAHPLAHPHTCVSYDEPNCPHCQVEITRGHVDWFWTNGLKRTASGRVIAAHNYCGGIISIGRELDVLKADLAEIKLYPWWPGFLAALDDPSKRLYGPT